jgi:hypothetical protein
MATHNSPILPGIAATFGVATADGLAELERRAASQRRGLVGVSRAARRGGGARPACEDEGDRSGHAMSVGHERGPGPMLTLHPGVGNTVGGHHVEAGGSNGAHRAAGDVKLGRNDGKKLLKAMKQHGPSGGGRPMPMATTSSSNASRLPGRASERDGTSSFGNESNGRGESGSLHRHQGPAKASLRSQKWSRPGEAPLPVVVGGGRGGRSQSSDEDEASTSGDSNRDDDSETNDVASWLGYCCPCCPYGGSAARRRRHLGSKGKMGSVHNHLLDGRGRTAHGGGGYGTQRMGDEFDGQGRAQNIEDSVADDNVQLLGRDGDDEFDSEWMIDSDDHQSGVQGRLGVGESAHTVIEAHDEFATDSFEALASQRHGGGGVGIGGIGGSGSGSGDGGGGGSDGTSTPTTDDPFDTLPFEQHRSITIITNNNSGGSGGGGSGGGTIHASDLFGDTDPFDTVASSRHGGVGDVPVDPFAPLPGHDESPNQHNA